MSIAFKAYMEDEFYVYHHVAIDEKIVSRHWQGLFDLLRDDKHEMIFEKFGIRTIENREEVAIYLGLIWRLVRGFTILAVPSFYSEEVAQCLNKKYKIVKWEYDVEEEGNTRG